MLGPGEYTVAVGVYPVLDLADTGSLQHAAIWHKPRSFVVRKPAGVAMDLGVVRHPARWRGATSASTVAPHAALEGPLRSRDQSSRPVRSRLPRPTFVRAIADATNGSPNTT